MPPCPCGSYSSAIQYLVLIISTSYVSLSTVVLNISLSTVVLNSRIDLKKVASKIFDVSKIHLRVGFM